jgi:hypothetical protein
MITRVQQFCSRQKERKTLERHNYRSVFFLENKPSPVFMEEGLGDVYREKLRKNPGNVRRMKDR